MKIEVDIDGVLTNDDDYILDTATKFCLENNLNTYVNPYEYELRKKFLWDKEIRDKYREEYYFNYVLNCPPRRFAGEVIKKLKEDGHKIYIITSRRYSTDNTLLGHKMRNIIKSWLMNHDIPYNEIYFSKDKTIEIKGLKLDIMIEDSSENIPVFVKYTHIFCFDCRYNRDLNCNNMTRVFSWYDVYRKILERKINSNE